MRKIFLLIVLLYFGSLYGQDNSVNAKREFENFIYSADSVKIQNIKNEKLDQIFEIYQYNQIISRELDFGLKESIFNITYSYKLDNELRYQTAEIHLFYFNDKMIDRLIIYEGKNIEISNRTDAEIEDYIQKHDSFYSTKTSLKDFINDVVTKEIFGDYCGFAMTKVKDIGAVELDSPENAEKYVKWMKSYNPEKQMWGYLEISKLLKKQAIELNSDETKIFIHIKERNAVIETCSGCEFGIFKRVFKENKLIL